MSQDTPSDFGTPFRALVDYCENNEIQHRRDPEEKSIHFGMAGAVANYHCHWRVSPDDELVQMRIYYPVRATDPQIRPLVADFVARANHNLNVGAFQLDMDDGEISFNLPQLIGDYALDKERISELFVTTFGTADRYFPALMLLMFAGHTAADAIYLAELEFHSNAVKENSPPVKAALPPKPASPPAKKKVRRPRRDPRLKSTQELPGLFDGKDKDTGEEIR